jgi:hypothetical protein
LPLGIEYYARTAKEDYALSKHMLSHKGIVMNKHVLRFFLTFLSLSWVIFVVMAETAVQAGGISSPVLI